MSLALLKSSIVVSFLTLISRVLGLVRDMLVARFFGVNIYTDAFFIAFKIPNFFRRLFSEGAFSQAFVPILSGYMPKQHNQMQEFINRVAGTLLWILCGFTVLVVTAAPYVVVLFAPGFLQNAEQLVVTSDMLRITFPYLMLISLTGFMSSILNSMNRFAVPAATPILLNLILIGGVLVAEDFFSNERTVFALAWAVLLAGIVQLFFQIAALLSLKIIIIPKWGWHHQGVQQVIRLMIPAIFGASVVQVSILLNGVMASFLPEGSISWIYYSDRLCELPLGVVGIAVATVILPKLSRLKQDNKTSDDLDGTLDWGLKLVLVAALPATIGLILLAEPILITLFQYDEFSLYDASQSSWSLMAYALGLIAFMWIKVLASAFFSCHDTKTPVRIGVRSLLFGVVVAVIATPLLHQAYGLGHAGLALGTVAGSWVNALFLFRGIHTKHQFNMQAWSNFCSKIGVASFMMACFLYWAKGHWINWGSWDAATRAMNLSIIIGGSTLLYVCTLWLMRLRFK